MSNTKRQGYDAAKRGDLRDTNPHPIETRKAFLWHDGWCEGAQGPIRKSSHRN